MNNYDHMAICEALCMRYPVGFSQEITDRVVQMHSRDIQLLDIKELNDLAVEYRERLRGLLETYRSAHSGVPAHTVRRVYISHESIFIRRQITDLWQIYRIIMADSHEMTTDYLAQLNSRKNTKTSHPTGKDHRAAA